MKKEQGHTGGVAVLADQETPISLLRDIKRLLSLQQATDMPADGEEYRDYAILSGAGDLYIDTDVQFGYAYIPNCPRDITIYSGTRGGLIGSFKAGAFVQFRMPRSTGVTITYAAGSAAQTLTVYLSAREVSVNPGEIVATLEPGTATDNRIFASTVVAVATADGASNTAGFFADSAGSNRPVPNYPYWYNGLTWDRPRTPNVFKTFSLAASSAEQTIWTPTAGKKFRLMGFVLTINTLAATVTFRDNTAGTTIFVTAGPAASIVAPSDLGNGILSAAANNRLTIQASAVSALVGTVWGTEE